MDNIRFIIGDATYPKSDGHKIIVHCCNDIGKWNAGFVLAISKRWATPRKHYLDKYINNLVQLGNVQFVLVEPDITVANMIGQAGIRSITNRRPVCYDSIRECLNKVAIFSTKHENASIHMPRICTGLAGGSWDVVEPIVNETLIRQGIPVFVYDLKT